MLQSAPLTELSLQCRLQGAWLSEGAPTPDCGSLPGSTLNSSHSELSKIADIPTKAIETKLA